MVNYNANDDIRESVVDALALLVKAAKESGADQTYLNGMAKNFTF
jgi:hypothetical protein